MPRRKNGAKARLRFGFLVIKLNASGFAVFRALDSRSQFAAVLQCVSDLLWEIMPRILKDGFTALARISLKVASAWPDGFAT
jgi:hypothetical protein